TTCAFPISPPKSRLRPSSFRPYSLLYPRHRRVAWRSSAAASDALPSLSPLLRANPTILLLPCHQIAAASARLTAFSSRRGSSLAFSPSSQVRNRRPHPKLFHEENLKYGLMDNYKNIPQFFYSLSPAQMEMFMNDDNPI
ncbi:Os05g0278950, partial [Oryza sativa Japonica Group]